MEVIVKRSRTYKWSYNILVMNVKRTQVRVVLGVLAELDTLYSDRPYDGISTIYIHYERWKNQVRNIESSLFTHQEGTLPSAKEMKEEMKELLRQAIEKDMNKE